MLISINNETFFIPHTYMTLSDATMPFKFTRKQFSLRLSFSMTKNKSLKQTFHKICSDLYKPVFSYGQLYAGLSALFILEFWLFCWSGVRAFDSTTVLFLLLKIYLIVFIMKFYKSIILAFHRS